jgi:sugar phosphate isomerase/epimerase
MRPLTLGYLTLEDVPPAELVSVAAAAGFDAVGIRITGRKKADPYFPIVGHRGAVREIKQRLDDTGIRLSNIGAYYVTPDIGAGDFAPIVDIAVELGAPLIVANNHDGDERHYLNTMAGYCDLAERAGIRLVLEFMRYSQATSLDHALRILDVIGRKNFGLLADPLHLSRSGGHPADLKKVAEDRIFLAQLCDSKGPPPVSIAEITHEARNGRLLPGEGDLPLDAFIDALTPGIELECEVPQTTLANLPAVERAKRVAQACRSFLTRHDAKIAR